MSAVDQAVRAANDRSVMLALLAWQLGLASPQQAKESLDAWHQDRSQSFEVLLQQKSRLSSQQSAWLAEVAAAVIARNQNDASASLDSFSQLSQVRSELARVVDPEATLDRSAGSGSAAGSQRPEPTQSGTSGSAANPISRFQILEQHKQGGMGEVFVANDREFSRKVALKKIRSDKSGDRLAQQHFQREAQLTGNLEHPGIVPAYSAGKDNDGQPYLAMRFIRGASLEAKISAFHQEHKDFSSGDFRRLITQFITVCNTVAYAHSKQILHRDLKPANVMVGDYGETLVVDWGLARGWEEDSAPASEFGRGLQEAAHQVTETESGGLVGTLAYMSPEQAGGRLYSFQSAADVFSLGATLYYLLTGKPPHPPAKSEQEQKLIIQNIQEGNFRPPRDVCPTVPKPLEAICLQAMARHSNERYSSALELAADLERYLADEPATAYREPFGQRVRRWMKRNRTAVAAAVVAMGMFLVGSVIYAAVVAGHNHTLTQKNAALDAAKTALEKSNSALQLANAAETEAKQDAERRRVEAETARDETGEVLNFLVKSFRSPDPSLDGEKLTVASLLDQAVAQVEFDLPQQPRAQAMLLNAISQTYAGLGLYAKALAAIDRSCSLCQLSLGESHEDTLVTLHNRATQLRVSGRLNEAQAQMEEVLRLALNKYGGDDQRLLSFQNGLGVIYLDQGKSQEALQLFRQVLERRRALLGPGHRDTLESINNYASALSETGDRASAIQELKAAIPLIEREFGSQHPKLLAILSNLGSVLTENGDLDEAIEVLQDTYDRSRSLYGNEHPNLLQPMINLSVAYVQRQDLARGAQLLKNAVKLSEATLGERHPDTLKARSNLAYTEEFQGNLDSAIEQGKLAVTGRDSILGRWHPDTFSSAKNLFSALMKSRKLTEAISIYDVYLAKSPFRATLDVPGFAHLLGAMGVHQLRKDEFAAAEPYLRDALAIRLKDKPDHPTTHEVQLSLGIACLGQEKFEEGERSLSQGYGGLLRNRSQLPAEVDAGIQEMLRNVVGIYKRANKPDEMQVWQKRLDDWSRPR